MDTEGHFLRIRPYRRKARPEITTTHYTSQDLTIVYKWYSDVEGFDEIGAGYSQSLRVLFPLFAALVVC